MAGTAIDSILTRATLRAKGKRKYPVINTSAGPVPFFDTGGDKPVILMTPDAPCIIEHHSELIEILRHDFRVVCFEMPGSGYAFPKAKYRFTVSESASMVKEIMDELKIEKAVLNFSCGNGLHALNFSKRFPERVTHLVLAQLASIEGMRDWTGHNIPKPLLIPYLGQVFCRAFDKKLSDKWFSVSLPRPSDHRESFSHISRESLKSGGCFCLASIVQGSSRSPDKDMLGAQHPTLMVYGGEDYSHRHTDFKQLTRTIPHANILGFEGCGHFPNLERPEAFADSLRRFVSG